MASVDDILGSTTQPKPTPAKAPAPKMFLNNTPGHGDFGNWGNKPVQDVISKGVDLITRLGQGAEAGLNRGVGAILPAIAHGNPSQQHDISETTRRMMLASPQEYAALPAWRRNANEFATGMETDLSTYLGGLGLTKAVAAHIGPRILPTVMRAGSAASRVAEAAHPAAGAVARTLLQKLPSVVHNTLVPGGQQAAHAIRNEAALHGSAGVQQMQRMSSLFNAGSTKAVDLERSLSQGFDRAIHGLTDAEQLQVYRRIHTGTIGLLPKKLQDAAKQIQAYDRAIPYLAGTKTLRKQMAKSGYALPEDLTRFNDVPNGRGIVRANQFVQNHIPLPHELDASEAQKLFDRYNTGGIFKRDAANTHNTQFLKRRPEDPDRTFTPIDNAAMHRELFKSSFKKAGKSLAAADTKRAVANLAAPTRTIMARTGPIDMQALAQRLNRGKLVQSQITAQDAEKLSDSIKNLLGNRTLKPVRTMQSYADVPAHIRGFFQDIGKLPGDPDTATTHDLLMGANDLNRASYFKSPTGHQLRMLSLLALHAPEKIPQAAWDFLRTKGGFASPEQEAKVFGEARKAGATGVPNIEQNKLQQALEGIKAPAGIAKKVDAVTQKVPAGPLRTAAQAVASPGKLASKYFGAVGKSVWGADEAMKSALYKKNLDFYGDPLIAAHHTQQAMVNYGRTSPLTEALRESQLSYFPTWRTRMPGAVAKGIVESPQNATALARLGTALGIGAGAFYGEPYGKGKDRKRLGSLATSEAAEIPAAPQSYVRGTLSPIGKLGVYGASKLLHHGQEDTSSPWWLYQTTKNESVPNFGLQNLPFAEDVQNATHTGPYGNQSLAQQLRFQLFGEESIPQTAGWKKRGKKWSGPATPESILGIPASASTPKPKSVKDILGI